MLETVLVGAMFCLIGCYALVGGTWAIGSALPKSRLNYLPGTVMFNGIITGPLFLIAGIVGIIAGFIASPIPAGLVLLLAITIAITQRHQIARFFNPPPTLTVGTAAATAQLHRPSLDRLLSQPQSAPAPVPPTDGPTTADPFRK